MTPEQHFLPEAEFVEFICEDTATTPPQPRGVWRILIVDDDPSVHRALAFAMNGVPIFDRQLELLNAYSAAEAFGILQTQRDIAVVVLDVVMESENAGLALVRQIRDELHIHDTRIILHTGQPGSAPDISAVRDYDINDYRTKAELGRGHLYTCLAAAIRAYRQIRTMEHSRQQLRRIIQAGNRLISEHDDRAVAAELLQQLAFVLGQGVEGAAGWLEPGCAAEHLQFCAVAGRYGAWAGHALGHLTEAGVRQCCQRSAADGRAHRCEAGLALRVGGDDGRSMLLFLHIDAAHGVDIDEVVVDTFVSHFASCLDNRNLLQRLHYEAYFDRMLGLPNRRSLSEQLDACYATGQHLQTVLALIDVDQFGELNEALGQAYGDALLTELGLRLRNNFASDITVARISADVFAVVGTASQVAPETVLPLFGVPLTVRGEETMVSVTIGLTRLADVEASGGAAALEAAFQALRAMKLSQRGQIGWYVPEMSRRTLERVTLLNGLRHALRTTGLSVAYQPQVALDDQRLIGLEALVRWRGERNQYIGPDRFIPVAEQSGLIREIGQFVLRQALAMLAQLHADGLDSVRMAVNVSAVQFRHPDFLRDLRQIVAESGVDPSKLELEITESVAMEDASKVRAMLDSIRELGIQLAIDDFGTGFSSLAQLKNLAFDRLKIDRAFVKDLTDDAPEASIVGVVVQLGQKLGIQVIAEGVETAEQAELLQRMGCQEAQGYLFAKPMEGAELRNWMREAQGRSRALN